MYVLKNKRTNCYWNKNTHSEQNKIEKATIFKLKTWARKHLQGMYGVWDRDKDGVGYHLLYYRDGYEDWEIKEVEIKEVD
jgi:hypothetical protein